MTRAERRRAKKNMSANPALPTYTGVTNARSPSSDRLRAAAVASTTNEQQISKKARRRRKSRDNKQYAKHCKDLFIIHPQDDTGRVPENPKVFMFFEGSKKNKPATFPHHAKGINVEVRSIHETSIRGGPGGFIYTGRGKIDPDYILCPQRACLKILDMKSLPGILDAFLMVIKVHPGSTNRHCMIVGVKVSE